MIQIDILLKIKLTGKKTMSIIQEFIHYFYQKNFIRHSDMKNIFTKYGIFQAKIFKDSYHEYLVIMSRDFFDLETPIIYSYAESQNCDALDHDMCYCNHQMDIALSMLRSDGGAIVYYSDDVRNIDGLLKDLHTRKLDTNAEVMHKSKIREDLKIYEKEFQSIGFIFENLNLSNVKLITHDINVVHVARKLDIKINKRASMIEFDYGKENTNAI